ncbi:MAG: hypothetical protein INR62_00040 [Rhodospirillales bacterium]|nr:hypothetical protein [Acetobacter sp.]
MKPLRQHTDLCTASIWLILGAFCIIPVQCSLAGTQQGPTPDINSHSGQPEAQSADVSSIENIVQAFYSAISAPAGGKLDRNRLLSLFVPSGRIAVGLPASDAHPANVLFLSPDQYADSSDSQTVNKGFFDKNPANQIERFGVMAHVYSTYESRTDPGDLKPMARGIKSFELLRRADRWYIVQVYWDSERPDNSLPERYLHDGTQ